MHPSHDQLNEFAGGALAEEAFEQIANHVDTCVACSDTVRELEASPSDPLIRELRGPKPEPEFEQEPECQDLVAVVQSMRPRVASADKDEPRHEHFSAESIKSLGPYQFIEELGRGGMGTVFKARHEHLDRLCAVKLLPPDRLKSKGIVERFRREMKAVGRFSHPNIVQATDAGETDGMHYLVMELVDGIDVARVVRKRGPLSVANACEIVRQAALGIAHAHQFGMIHRDIKPANLMLTRTAVGDVQVKVLDLGLALLHEADAPDRTELTAAGNIMGTVEYMAPEQGTDSHAVDARADVYSLGATLFKLLSGRTPFPPDRHNSTLKLMMAKASGAAPSLAEFRDDLPDELVSLVDRMVACNPQDRIPSASDVATALAPFATEHDLDQLLEPNRHTESLSDARRTVAHSPKKSPDDSPARVVGTDPLRHSRSRPRLFALIAGVGLAVLAAITLYIQTAKGTLVVEIHDDQIEVTAVDGGIRITRQDKSGDPITVKPGEHKLHVTRGDLEFDTESFVLRRGEKVSLRVVLLDGEVQVLRDGKVLGRGVVPVVAADSRAVAKKVFALGGHIYVNDNVKCSQSEQLPDEPFEIVSVSLRDCPVVDEDLRWFSNLPKLEGLYLSGTSSRLMPVTDRGLALLTNLPSLKDLSVTRTQITDDGLAYLSRFPNLKSLDVSHTEVSDDGMRHVAQLQNLRWIDVSGTKVTGAVLQRLANCQNLEVLLVAQIPIDDEELRAAPDWPHLRELRINSRQLTSEGLQGLTRYRDTLEILYANTLLGVEEDGWSVLRELQQLRLLYVNENLESLTDDIVAQIATLPHLQRLNLNNTAVTDTGLRHLHGWGLEERMPVHLHIQQTNVTAEGIATLQATLPPGSAVESDFTDAEIKAAMTELSVTEQQTP